MADSQIIDDLGGDTAVAKFFDDRISRQAVFQWRTKGIPSARRQILKLLRPDVFSRYKDQQTAA